MLVNCWPNPNADGTCDVNIDYELLASNLKLEDVTITVPLPANTGAPVVASADGSYDHDSRNHVLLWRIPVIDAENPDGAIEFQCVTLFLCACMCVCVFVYLCVCISVCVCVSTSLLSLLFYFCADATPPPPSNTHALFLLSLLVYLCVCVSVCVSG